MNKYTVEEWFSILPQHIRKKAIANSKAYLKYPELRFSKTERSFKQAISGSFVWKDTKEGYEYWKKIADKDWGTPQENKTKQ